MSDLIKINALETFCHLGVPEAERAHPQKVLISLELKTGDFDEIAKDDDIVNTVDYSLVIEAVRALAHAKPHRLIETLASEIAAAVLRDFAVREVTVEIEKFILPQVRSVAVRLKRKAPKPKKKSKTAVITSSEIKSGSPLSRPASIPHDPVAPTL